MRYLIDRYLRVRSLTLLLLDMAVIALVTGIAVWLRLGHTFDYTFSARGYGYPIILILLVHMVALYYHELYSLRGQVAVKNLGVAVAQSVAIASAGLFGIYYLVPQLAIGRGIFLINMLLLPPLLTATRVLYLWMGSKEALLERVAVLGEPEPIAELVERISGQPDYHLVGVIRPGSDEAAGKDGEEAHKGHGLPLLGRARDLRRLVPQHDVDTILVAMRERRGRLPMEDLLYFKLLGVKVDNQDDFLERVTGRVPVTGLPPSSLIFSEGFRRIDLYQRVKIIPDAIMALVLLIVLSPLLLGLALLVRMDSKGPALYRQTRVGRAGQLFQIAKFRTMRTDAEAAGAQFAQDGDPRITRVGRYLRNLRLDELPQLFNVLRGEMAFVGPRPERPEFVQELQEKVPYYYLRTVVRPGITGWAQIRYPYGETVKQHREKLEHDLYYIKNISLALDMMIAFDTVRVMLFVRGSR